MEGLPQDIYSEIGKQLDDLSLTSLGAASRSTLTKTLTQIEKRRQLRLERDRQYSKPLVYKIDAAELPFRDISVQLLVNHFNTEWDFPEIQSGDVISVYSYKTTLVNLFYYVDQIIAPLQVAFFNFIIPPSLAFPEFPIEYYSETDETALVWIDLPKPDLVSNKQKQADRYLVCSFQVNEIPYNVILLDLTNFEADFGYFKGKLDWAFLNGQSMDLSMFKQSSTSQGPEYTTRRKKYFTDLRLHKQNIFKDLDINSYDEHFTFLVVFE